MHRTRKSFRCARTCSWSSITAAGVAKNVEVFTGSIARSASRRYLVYSEADFEVFRPAGATRCTDGGEIWHGGGIRRRQGCRTQKLKFLLRFDQNVEYKRPAGAYPLRDFHTICRVCTPFQDALAVKIWLDLLEGLWSYGGFKLTVSDFPQNFQCPLAAKLCVRPQKF